PRIVEHLGPFGLLVDLHLRGEIHTSFRAFASTRDGSCRRAEGRSRAARLCRSKRNRVNRTAFSEVERAAVARNVEVRNSAAESASTTASFTSRSIPRDD